MPNLKLVIAQLLSLSLIATPVFANGAYDQYDYNPRFGNDRIIFAAYTKSAAARDEGIGFGGTPSAAKKMCLRAKDAFELRYEKGICDKIDAQPEANSWAEVISDFMILRQKLLYISGVVAGTGLVVVILFARNKLKDG